MKAASGRANSASRCPRWMSSVENSPPRTTKNSCEGCFLFAIVAWAPGIVFKKLGKGTTSGSGEFAKLAPAYLGSCPFMLLLLFLFFPLFGLLLFPFVWCPFFSSGAEIGEFRRRRRVPSRRHLRCAHLMCP